MLQLSDVNIINIIIMNSFKSYSILLIVATNAQTLMMKPEESLFFIGKYPCQITVAKTVTALSTKLILSLIPFIMKTNVRQPRL